MKKNRIGVSFLLLCLTLALLFTGCKGQKAPPEDTAATDTGEDSKTEENWVPTLPRGLSFGSETDPVQIRFLIAEPSRNKGGRFSERSICLEDFDETDTSASKVDSKVYGRNCLVEKNLGVLILPTVIDDGIITNTLYNDLLSGVSDFDVLCGYQAHDTAIAAAGLLADFNTLGSQDADYIALEQDYWSQTYNEALSYKGKMFWITGELSLRYLGGMYCTFVNLDRYKAMFEAEYGSIYDVVEAGEWTLDTMMTMSRAIWDDTDASGKADENDSVLGFVTEGCDMLDGMAIGAGVNFSERDSDGDISITFADNSKTQKAFSFTGKMHSFLYGDYGAYVPEKFNHSATSMTIFASGKALFTHDKIYQAENYLTDMKNYGIIPSPMLDSEQNGYRAAIHDGCTLFGLYRQSESLAAAAATLEAMAAISHTDVTTAYYDEALKSRYSRDPQSAKMIDLIRDSVYIDFAFGWGNSLNAIHNFFRDAVQKEPTSSMFRKYASGWKEALNKLTASLEEA